MTMRQKKPTYGSIGPYKRGSKEFPALKNAAVAKSCLSVDFIIVKNFQQVHDGK